MPLIWVWVDGQQVPAVCTTTAGTTSVYFNLTTATNSCTDWQYISMGNTAATSSIWQHEQIRQQAMQMMLAQQAAGNIASCNNHYVNMLQAQPRTETGEERAAREERQRRAAEEQIKRERERAAAQVKARELLLTHLTPEQRDTVARHGWFVVEGGRSRKRYRINTGGYAGNIEELDADGNVVATLCCHARVDIPVADQHLTQKFMLESDEQEFVARANRTRRR